ncbi:MAG: hypothetical protein Q9184_004328 [Pyrenodesmia sp. 2 TL-2023]
MSEDESASERSSSMESLGYKYDEPLLNFLVSPNKKRRRPTHPNTPDCSSSEEDVVEAIVENVQRLGPAPPGRHRPSDDLGDPRYEAPGGPNAGEPHYEFRFNEGEKPVKVLIGGVKEFTRAPSPESPVSPTTRDAWRPYDLGHEFLYHPSVALNQAYFTDMYEQRVRDGTPSSASSINSNDGFYEIHEACEEIRQDFDEVNYEPPPPMQDPGSGPLPDDVLETFQTPEQTREDEKYSRKMMASYGKMAEDEKRVRDRWRANYTKNKKPGGAASIAGQPSPLTRPPVPEFWDNDSQRTHDANGQPVYGRASSAEHSSGDGARDDSTGDGNRDDQGFSVGSSGADQGGGDQGEDRRDSSDKDSNDSRKRKGSTSSAESDDSSESSGNDKPAKSPRKKARTFKDAGPRPRDYKTPDPPTPSTSGSDGEGGPDDCRNRSFKPSKSRPRDYQTPSVPNSAKSSLTGSNGSNDEHGGAERRKNNDMTGKNPSPGSVSKSPTSSSPLFSPPGLSSSSESSPISDNPRPPPAPPLPPRFPAFTPAALPSIESSDESSEAPDDESDGIDLCLPSDALTKEDTIGNHANVCPTKHSQSNLDEDDDGELDIDRGSRSQAPSPFEPDDREDDAENGDESSSSSSPSPPPGHNWPNAFLDGVHPFSNPARSGLFPSAIDSPSQSESSPPPRQQVRWTRLNVGRSGGHILSRPPQAENVPQQPEQVRPRPALQTSTSRIPTHSPRLPTDETLVLPEDFQEPRFPDNDAARRRGSISGQGRPSTPSRPIHTPRDSPAPNASSSESPPIRTPREYNLNEGPLPRGQHIYEDPDPDLDPDPYSNGHALQNPDDEPREPTPPEGENESRRGVANRVNNPRLPSGPDRVPLQHRTDIETADPEEQIAAQIAAQVATVSGPKVADARSNGNAPRTPPGRATVQENAAPAVARTQPQSPANPTRSGPAPGSNQAIIRNHATNPPRTPPNRTLPNQDYPPPATTQAPLNPTRPSTVPGNQRHVTINANGSPVPPGANGQPLALSDDQIHHVGAADSEDTPPSPPAHEISLPPTSSTIRKDRSSSSIEVQEQPRPGETVRGRRVGPDGSPLPQLRRQQTLGLGLNLNPAENEQPNANPDSETSRESTPSAPPESTNAGRYFDIPEDPQSPNNNDRENQDTTPFHSDSDEPNENNSPRTQENRRRRQPMNKEGRAPLAEISRADLKRRDTGLGTPPSDADEDSDEAETEEEDEPQNNNPNQHSPPPQPQNQLPPQPPLPPLHIHTTTGTRLPTQAELTILASTGSSPLSSPDPNPPTPPSIPIPSPTPPPATVQETWLTRGRLRPRRLEGLYNYDRRGLRTVRRREGRSIGAGARRTSRSGGWTVRSGEVRRLVLGDVGDGGARGGSGRGAASVSGGREGDSGGGGRRVSKARGRGKGSAKRK